jgi:hypothetical protein
MEKGNKYHVRRDANSVEIINGRNTMAIVSHDEPAVLDRRLAECNDPHAVDRVLEQFCAL